MPWLKYSAHPARDRMYHFVSDIGGLFPVNGTERLMKCVSRYSWLSPPHHQCWMLSPWCSALVWWLCKLASFAYQTSGKRQEHSVAYPKLPEKLTDRDTFPQCCVRAPCPISSVAQTAERHSCPRYIYGQSSCLDPECDDIRSGAMYPM